MNAPEINVKMAEKNLKLAGDLIRNALEDLKNIESFRDSDIGNLAARNEIYKKLEALIEWCKKNEG